MNILVAKNGSQLGPFSESDIRAKLAAGEFAPTDFGWKEGMAAWSPLSQMFAAPAPQPAAAPSQPATPPAASAPASYSPQPQGSAPAPDSPQPQGQSPSYSPQPYNAQQGQYSAPQTYNSPYPAPYQQGAGQQWGAQGSSGYAGFWIRFGAILIDIVILFIINFVVGVVLGFVLSLLGGATRELLNIVGFIVNVFDTVIYFSLLESSANQATFGKMALGLKVTDLNGNRISLGKAVGRNFARYISGFILLIGYIMAAFTERKQALHDIMAGTLVVKK